jgi:hypothetical protein
MRMHLTLLLSLLLNMTAEAQQSTDNGRIATLLSGRKNPGDQEIIISSRIDSLGPLLSSLKIEQDQNKVPIYCRLIGLKYRQFYEQLTLEKRNEIITLLISRIKDEGQTAYLIHSSLEHLHGINHPAVLQLIEFYSNSDVDWTRDAAQSLKGSLLGATSELEGDSSLHEIIPTPKPPSVVQPPTLTKEHNAKLPAPSEKPTSSTPWSIGVLLVITAVGLLWLVLKKPK